MAVALVPGMAAREVVVGALGTRLRHRRRPTRPAGLDLGGPMVPGDRPGVPGLVHICAAMRLDSRGAVRRETNSWKWPLVMFGYMITLAYLAALVVYQIASRL